MGADRGSGCPKYSVTTVSQAGETSSKRLKFARHLLRARRGKSHVVLLLYSCDSIIVTRADVNWRVQKIRAGLDPRVSIAQVVFVRTSHVDAGDATAILREQRRNVTNTFSSSREPCTRDWPLFRSGKTAMQCVNRGECHRTAPGGGVVARMLRPVTCQKHPALTESNCPIELDKVIPILTFEIARGTSHQDRPTLSRIEIRGRRQYGDGIWRHRISSLRGQRFFLRAQRHIGLDR